MIDWHLIAFLKAEDGVIVCKRAQIASETTLGSIDGSVPAIVHTFHNTTCIGAQDCVRYFAEGNAGPEMQVIAKMVALP